LAGIYPCGIITLVTELFGAESKSQVYGTLHAFLAQNKDITESISMLSECMLPLCYIAQVQYVMMMLAI